MNSPTILAGTLLDGQDPTPQSDVAIEVRAGQIRRVAPIDHSRDYGPTVVDARSDTITPGFVDAHVHLLFDAGTDHAVTRARVEDRSLPELALQGAANAMAILRGGVTTVRDCGDREYVTLALRSLLADGVLPGPRLLAAGPPITTTGGHLHWCGLRADDPLAARRAVRELCERGVDLVKIMASGGNMTAGSNPRASQFEAHEFRQLIEEAHRLGRPVAAHALNTRAIGEVVDAGVDTIEHCVWQTPDGEIFVDEAILERLVGSGAVAVLTFAGIARRLLPDATEGTAAERTQAAAMSRTGTVAGDFAWARKMRAAGAPLVVASDAGTRFTAFDRFTETIKCGIEALDTDLVGIIPFVTSQAAAALGLAGQVGSVEPGKVADLVRLRGRTEPGRRDPGPIRTVWQAGVRTIEQGALLATGMPWHGEGAEMPPLSPDEAATPDTGKAQIS